MKLVKSTSQSTCGDCSLPQHPRTSIFSDGKLHSFDSGSFESLTEEIWVFESFELCTLSDLLVSCARCGFCEPQSDLTS